MANLSKKTGLGLLVALSLGACNLSEAERYKKPNGDLCTITSNGKYEVCKDTNNTYTINPNFGQEPEGLDCTYQGNVRVCNDPNTTELNLKDDGSFEAYLKTKDFYSEY